MAKGTSGSKPTRRIVSPVKGGGYRVDAPGAKRASATAPTKAAATQKAKTIVSNQGGGEVTFRDAQGRIENSNTVRPGNDPSPPRDKKH